MMIIQGCYSDEKFRSPAKSESVVSCTGKGNHSLRNMPKALQFNENSFVPII